LFFFQQGISADFGACWAQDSVEQGPLDGASNAACRKGVNMWQKQRILIVHLREQGEPQARRAALRIGAVEGVDSVDVFDWKLRARNIAADAEPPGYEATRSETASKRSRGKPRRDDTEPR
jgi:hypothetical protein